MSEFKIVKCKSCDAALVELPNEKLNKCVQCGYSFSQKVSKRPKLESVIEQAFQKGTETINYEDYTDAKKPTPQQPQHNKATSQTIRESNPQISKKAKNKALPKKPASIIGTIVKWYIILFIASGFIRSFF